jgi:hypothetical protein
MFSKVSKLYWAVFALVTLLWLVQVGVPREKDYALSREMNAKREVASTSSMYSSTHQTRQGVRKEIWFTGEDGKRLHHRIESRASVLTLDPAAHHFDLIENLQGIKGSMQDKLYTSDSGDLMQQMRFFEADTGIYRYKTQQFNAQTVALALYRLPGQTLPTSLSGKQAFLKGIAKDASFCISGKTSQFQAQHFKATLAKEES